MCIFRFFFFFFQAEDGIRDLTVTGVQTCALPILQFGLTAGLLWWVFRDPAKQSALRDAVQMADWKWLVAGVAAYGVFRSEEHTSELQSQSNLVCRLLLEKKKNKIY